MIITAKIVLALIAVAALILGVWWILAIGGCERPTPNPFMIQAASCELDAVKAAVDQAVDGDTVHVPAGTASWTERLDVSKSITLEGETTTEGCGTADASATDRTVIQDDTSRSGNATGIIKGPQGAFRVTGFTFRHGTITGFGQGAIRLTGDFVANKRVDHCHFDHLYQKNVESGSGAYGVSDNCLHDIEGNGQPYYNSQGAGLGGEQNGNGAWADFPYFGTDKFFFIEDNTIVGNGKVTTSGTIDSSPAGRFVTRHNYFIDAKVGGHGTEGGVQRGLRAVEIYNNTFDWRSLNAPNVARSGTVLIHDNKFIGKKPDHAQRLQVFRAFGAVGDTTMMGSADGTSPYDENDTEGDMRYVPGHQAHLFDSGMATESQPQGTLVDGTKNWTVNQWKGFSIHDATGSNKGTYITSNTATTITYAPYDATDRGLRVIFNADEPYQIYRVIKVLDQSGRGKGGLIKGNPAMPQEWLNQQNERCFSWNNVHEPSGTVMGINSAEPTIVEGDDYVNLGNGFTETPQQVKDFYTAAVNGVQYAGPYTYPHPLRGGGGATPTSTPIILPTAAQSPNVTPTPNQTPTETSTPPPSPAPTATPIPTGTPAVPPSPTPLILILRPGDTISITVPKSAP